MREFRGKVAVVTGAASGIGRALARRFAEEGMKVVLADVEVPALDAAVKELRREEFDVLGVPTDASRPESVEKLAEETLRAYGKVHVLCNNAGVSGGNGGPRSIIWEASLNDWRWLTNVNYWGVAHGIRVFVPVMVRQDEEGHVVNTSSIAGLMPGAGVYGATKHAVVSMSESLYRDFRRLNLKLGASVLCPGFIDTRINSASRNRPPELMDDLASGDEERQRRVDSPSTGGLPPAQVADVVLEGIRNEQLYIFTPDVNFDRMRDRFESILARRSPTLF